MKNYLKKLIAWKSAQNLALMSEECILDLRKLDGTAEEIAQAEAQVAKRTAYIAELEAKIAEIKGVAA